jgi:arylamine N-acetyltransferase
MSLEIWNDPLASGGHEARELFAGHFRIASGGADLPLLRLMIAAYSNLPYENLTKIIRKHKARSPEERLRGPVEVVSGFVERHTGGTCFSLTYCLGSMLSSAGFRCYPVMADMRRPNIHCALVVEMGGKRYLVDPGYLVGEPVELSGFPVQVSTTFGTVELRPRRNDSYDLFTLEGGWDELSGIGPGEGASIEAPRAGERKWRYTVRAASVSHADFMKYWQDSFALPMMNNLLLTRLTSEGHLYVKNHHLRVRTRAGKTNENIRAGLEARIASEFGIPPDVTAEAREHVERLRRSWRRGERKGPSIIMG